MISNEYADLLKNVLDGYEQVLPVTEGDQVVLDDHHAAHIYFLCVSHLNSLEIALQAWLVSIGDDEILEQQLKYLVKPEHGHYVLQELREVLGGKETFPAIHEFVAHIKDKQDGGSGRKSKVV